MASVACVACGDSEAPQCRRVFIDCRTGGAGVLVAHALRLRVAGMKRPLAPGFTSRSISDAAMATMWRHAFETSCPTCRGWCPVRIVDWSPTTKALAEGAPTHVQDLAAFNATKHACGVDA